MTSKIISKLLSSVLIMVLLCIGVSAASEDNTIAVTDDQGRQVSFLAFRRG